MQVQIDNIIFSLQKAGGISAYWFELCRRLLNDGDFACSFYEYKNAAQNIFRKQLQIPPHLLAKSKKLPVKIERYAPVIGHAEGGVFHSSYYRTIKFSKRAKSIVTVHDFIYEKYASGLKRRGHIWQKSKAIADSDVVICVSENTKRDLCELYPQHKSKDIRVIYNGISESYYPLNGKTNQHNPYVLYVGVRSGYKNFAFVVKWLSALKDFELRIVGAPLSKEEQKMLTQLLPNRFHLASSISNSHLNELYNNAACLVYPSSYEGFGIPVLEAMSAGCPAITLNTSSLPEVCGNAGLMAEKLSPELFTELLRYAVANRTAISAKGIVHAAKFSWDKCYKETSSIYKDM
ncbi:MAG: glycosyltransferase family 4 protein [Prevotellaceae bacterium]|jgi:mannosyltransferase|nr:glycosyltransferase family 4 protein [Prevotellaceae bacterium]